MGEMRQVSVLLVLVGAGLLLHGNQVGFQDGGLRHRYKCLRTGQMALGR